MIDIPLILMAWLVCGFAVMLAFIIAEQTVTLKNYFPLLLTVGLTWLTIRYDSNPTMLQGLIVFGFLFIIHFLFYAATIGDGPLMCVFYLMLWCVTSIFGVLFKFGLVLAMFNCPDYNFIDFGFPSQLKNRTEIKATMERREQMRKDAQNRQEYDANREANQEANQE